MRTLFEIKISLYPGEAIFEDVLAQFEVIYSYHKQSPMTRIQHLSLSFIKIGKLEITYEMLFKMFNEKRIELNKVENNATTQFIDIQRTT